MDEDIWNLVNGREDDMEVIDRAFEEASTDLVSKKKLRAHLKRYPDIDSMFKEGKDIDNAALKGVFYPHYDVEYIHLKDYPHDYRLEANTECMSFQSDDNDLYNEKDITEAKTKYKFESSSTMNMKNFVCTLRFKGEIQRSIDKMISLVRDREMCLQYQSIYRAFEMINVVFGRLLDRYQLVDLPHVDLHFLTKYNRINSVRPFKMLDPVSSFGNINDMESMMVTEIPIQLDSRFRILFDDKYTYSMWTENEKKMANVFPLPLSQLIRQGAVCDVLKKNYVSIEHVPIDWYVPFTDIRTVSYSILKRFVPVPSSNVYKHMVTASGPYMSIWENELSRKVDQERIYHMSVADNETFGPLGHSKSIEDVPDLDTCSIMEYGELRERFIQQFAYIQLGKRLSRRLLRRARVSATVVYLINNQSTLLDIAKKSILYYETSKCPPRPLVLNRDIATRIVKELDIKWLQRANKYIGLLNGTELDSDDV